jgi:hypothetical protein
MVLHAGDERGLPRKRASRLDGAPLLSGNDLVALPPLTLARNKTIEVLDGGAVSLESL